MLSVGRIFRPGHRQFVRGARLILLDDDIARRGAMKPSLAGRNHVERHHAAEHAPARQAVAQHGGITDAVLQADDDDVGWRVSRDDIGHLGGIGALDRDQHHAAVVKNGRIFR
jgi:hypothetical protein